MWQIVGGGHSREEALLTLSAKSCAVKTSQVKADVRREHGNISAKWGLKKLSVFFLPTC